MRNYADVRGRTRFVVIVIAAILVVTVVVAGLQRENQIDIEVDEGYDEITVEVPPPPEEDGKNRVHKYFENKSIATTLINEDYGSIELEVSPRRWTGSENAYMCFIEIRVRGNLSSELNPEHMVIQTQGIEAPELERLPVDHLSSKWNAEGLELWSGTKRRDGAWGEQETLIGSYVENDDFSANTEIHMEHPTADLTQEPITLEFRATLRGLSEEVTATTRITFTQE